MGSLNLSFIPLRHKGMLEDTGERPVWGRMLKLMAYIVVALGTLVVFAGLSGQTISSLVSIH